MKRILVGVEDKLIQLQIDRIFKARSFAYEIAPAKIAKEQAQRYDVLVVHPSWRLPSLAAFVENLVLARLVVVIYVAPTIATGAFAKIQESPYFIRLNEAKIESELPLAIDLSFKFSLETKRLLREVKTIKNKLETTQSYHQAKYVLMAKGHVEESAHQVILKLAMDEQITKQAACLKIIAENTPSGLQKKREASIIND
ncbi:MAG: hypothetical protein MZU97_15250 [Bacillus subtilis]|nr:hypothetical protein [Bacillus subtilis]